MKVKIDKSDCVIEKPCTAAEAEMYKGLHGSACTVILEEGDEGFDTPVTEEPQPEQSGDDAPPAPSEVVTDPAGVPDLLDPALVPPVVEPTPVFQETPTVEPMPAPEPTAEPAADQPQG